MKVLAIDTSTYTMGVAVIDETTVLGECTTHVPKNHSTRLMPAINQLFTDIDMHPQQLDRIVVAQGPGSYTGLRIGVTTAKTLAWTLKIPLVGVSSLEVLAQNGRYFDGVICPIFDARRQQVYTGLYQNQEGAILNVKEDRNVPIQDWLTELHSQNKQVLFVGADCALHRTTIESTLGDQAQFSTLTGHVQRASELARLGMERAPAHLHQFVPHYLRLAEAETKWLEAKKN